MIQRPLSLLLPAMIAPWVFLIAAWKSTSHRERHWLLTFFVVIYGASITIAYDPLGIGPDGVGHLLRVYTHYVDLGFDQFLSELWLILTLRPPITTNDDVYIHVLSYFTGGLLGEPRFFFPIVALVYGYFFTGSMLEVFKHFKLRPRGYIFLAFAFLFVLVKNIEGVNTVRTWTGMWILVYACLRYYSTKQLRYVVLMFVPPLIHIAYLVLALPTWLVLLLGNKKRAFALIFVASSFTTFVNPGSVAEVLSGSELGADKVRGYYIEEARDTSREKGERIWAWFEKFGLQKWAVNILIYTLLLKNVYFRAMNRYQATLFSIGLLTLALSNSTWYFYAVSNRSWIVGLVFILAAYLSAMQRPETNDRIPGSDPLYIAGLHASLLLFIPYVLYNLSTLLDFPSVFIIGLPFLALLAPESNMSLKEAAKWLLDVIF